MPACTATIAWTDVQDQFGITREALLADVDGKAGGRAVQAVYIAGSIVDGYGNSRSDVDVYVLVDIPAGTSRPAGYEVSVSKGRSIQFDFVPLYQVEGAITELEQRPFEDISMSLMVNQLLHRLLHCVVLRGESTIQRLRQRLIDARYSVFSSLVKQMQVDNALQDAYGAWDARCFETATYNVRHAVHRAFDAVLALHGRTATNEKWVFEKSRQALGSDHPARTRFIELFGRMPAAFDAEAVVPCFSDNLRFLQACFDSIAVHELAAPAPAATTFCSAADQVLRHASVHAGRKNPTIHLRRIRGKNVAHDMALPRRELSDRAGLAWALLSSTATTAEAIRVASDLRPDLFTGLDVSSLAGRLEDAWISAGMLLA